MYYKQQHTKAIQPDYAIERSCRIEFNKNLKTQINNRINLKNNP